MISVTQHLISSHCFFSPACPRSIASVPGKESLIGNGFPMLFLLVTLGKCFTHAPPAAAVAAAIGLALPAPCVPLTVSKSAAFTSFTIV